MPRPQRNARRVALAGAVLLLAAALPGTDAEAQPGLWLELSSPPATETATPCTAARLLAAVQVRRPFARLRHEGQPGPDDLLALVDAQASGLWTLAVSTGEGLPLLRRDLPSPGADCVEMADTAALILDRFLAELPEAQSNLALEPARPRHPLPQTRLSLQAGPALRLAAARSLSPGLELGLEARKEPFRLAILAAAFWPTRALLSPEDPSAGRLNLSEAELRLDAARRLDLGAGSLLLRALVGTTLAWSWAQGPALFQSKTVFALSPFGGVGLGWEIPLSAGLDLGAGAQGRVHLTQTRFGVEGYAASLTTPRFDLDFSLTLSRHFF